MKICKTNQEAEVGRSATEVWGTNWARALIRDAEEENYQHIKLRIKSTFNKYIKM
jgi:hypothetical protein